MKSNIVILFIVFVLSLFLMGCPPFVPQFYPVSYSADFVEDGNGNVGFVYANNHDHKLIYVEKTIDGWKREMIGGDASLARITNEDGAVCLYICFTEGCDLYNTYRKTIYNKYCKRNGVWEISTTMGIKDNPLVEKGNYFVGGTRYTDYFYLIDEKTGEKVTYLPPLDYDIFKSAGIDFVNQENNKLYVETTDSSTRFFMKMGNGMA